MADSYYKLNADDPGAADQAERLAAALERQRQVGMMFMGSKRMSPLGKLLMDNYQRQQELQAGAGEKHSQRGLERYKAETERMAAESEAGARGPQDNLGGSRVPAYEAKTHREAAEGWELHPDPLLKGGHIMLQRSTGKTVYLRPGGMWHVGDQQQAPQAAPGAQPAPQPQAAPSAQPAGPQGAQNAPPQAGPQLQVPDVNAQAYAQAIKDSGEQGSEIVGLDRSIASLERALLAVRKRPSAFGMGQDIAGYLPGDGAVSGALKKAVGVLQQNRRSKEDIEARTDVFQNANQAMKELGGARAFSQGEREIFRQSQPADEDNSKVIEGKFTSALNLARARRDEIRRQAMPHLFGPAASGPAAAPSLRDKYGLRPRGAQ